MTKRFFAMFKIKFWQNPFNIAIFISVLILLVTCVAYFIVFSGGLSSEQSEWANFGAYIGGTLGAIFAFMSFLILLNAFNLQKEELSTAISALNKSADSNEKQVKNIEAQKFETTFYSLLQLHNQTLKDISINSDRIKLLLDSCNKSDGLKKEDKSISGHLKYRQDMILADIELSQYFRILYQVLKFVAKNNTHNSKKIFQTYYLGSKQNLSEDEKMYASIVRSFVPVELLPVLALNCITTYGGIQKLGEYQDLLERYEFLEHIRLERLQDNLATFLILDSYSYAFGDNSHVEKKVHRINAKYFRKFGHQLTDGCCLHVYYTSKPIVKPRFKCEAIMK